MSKIRFIDVIRVLGLFLVLTYHLFCDALPGGFLGVDIFFTFSGYLITSLIISSFSNKGNFNFISYIKRRFRRIFPLLFFSLIFTLPFVKLISGDFTVNIDKQIASSLGFVSNYFEILSGGSYEDKLVPHLYVHTWSLAIEFHYYIIWGLLASLFSFVFSKCKNKITLFKVSLLASSVILGTLSYFRMQYLFAINQNQSVAYWSSTSHIYSFFIGSILGVLFGLKLSNNISEKLKKSDFGLKIIATILVPIIFIAIFVLCSKTNFENEFTYHYGFLIISILTVILIFLTRILHEIVSENFKEPAIIGHIANISYPMYLFHWPFFIIFSNIVTSNWLASLYTIVCSYLLSVFTVYFIEPIFYKSRYQTEIKPLKKNIIVTSSLSIICILLSCNIIINKQDISALEQEQMVGKIIQNIDKIDYLEKAIENINENPLLQKSIDKNTNYATTPKSNSADETNTDTSANNNDTSNTVDVITTTPIPNENTNNTISNIGDLAKNNDSSDNNVSVKDTDASANNNVATNTDASTNDDVATNTDASTNDVVVYPNITIIGDSVTLGARKKLLDTIPNSYVDAKGSRPLNAGYKVFMELKESDSLGDYVVIALGTNGIPAFATYIEKFINDLPSGKRLIFVTPYDGRWTSTWNSYKTTQYLRGIENKYEFVTIADWAKKVSSNQNLLGSDKIHIGGKPSGINAFVDTITNAIDIASTKNAK